MMEYDYVIGNMKITESQQLINYCSCGSINCIIHYGSAYDYTSYDINNAEILWSDLCTLKHIPRVREKFKLTVFRFAIADFRRLQDCLFCLKGVIHTHTVVF